MGTIFDGLSVPGLAIGDGMITLPLWAMAALLATLALFVVMTFVRGGLVGLTVLIALIALAIGTNWVLNELHRTQGRHALEARLQALGSFALAPGSALSCLDGGATDAIAIGCEQALFSRPENVAAATSYAATRLALLSDGLQFAARQDADFERRLDHLRDSLARDRFGITSHVLMAEHGCSADQCDRLALLRDPTQMRANMRDKVFDALVTRYTPAWATPKPSADAGAPASAAVVASPVIAESPPVAPAVAPEPPAARPAPAPPRRPPPRAARPRPPAQTPPVALNPPRP